MRKIILASGSPRRKKILKLAGIGFKAIKSKLDENILINKLKKTSHKKLAEILALGKALSIVETCCGTSTKRDEIIAAFDTIVICKNKIIGKPEDKKDALRKILFLSNKTHKVITGICLINLKSGKILVNSDITKVTMKKISKEEALSYIKTKEPLDKAGAYAVQGKGKRFVKKITGDYLNVVGLPLGKFILMLRMSLSS